MHLLCNLIDLVETLMNCSSETLTFPISFFFHFSHFSLFITPFSGTYACMVLVTRKKHMLPSVFS